MIKKFPLFFFLFVGVLTLSAKIEAKANNKYCFGAVGKQCATPDKMNGQKPSPLNIVACSKIEKNQTNCWVSPGSIEHDNCCAKHPQGVMCSSETKNDGFCAKEWEDAYKDISKRMAWYHVYNVGKGADLSSVPSKRMQKFGGRETKTTQALCAPGGTKLFSSYDSGFCCAGQAKKQGDIMTCAQETAAKKSESASKKSPEVAKKSQDFLKKAQEAFAQLAAFPPPPPLPILPKPKLEQPPIDSTPAPQRADPHPLDLIYKSPPPPPQEEQQALTAGQPCDPNVPKYEQRGCVEAEQHAEEAPPPDCGAGAHWSPTLQSCQQD